MPSNPEVRIKEGERINFHVDATGHPFYIKTTNTTGTGASFTAGTGAGYMTPRAFKKKRKDD